MASLREKFRRSLYAEVIDPVAYRDRFVALASEPLYVESCIQLLVRRPTRDGFSRLGLLLYEAGHTGRACELWERDIAAGEISWWQRNCYMKAVFQEHGATAAERVAETTASTVPDRMNSWATLGLLLQADEPQRAVELMERDVAEKRLTAGFKLNYACALADVGRVDDAISMVEEAYRERAELRNGYLRLVRAIRSCPPQIALELFCREKEHGGLSPEAYQEILDRLLRAEDIATVLGTIASVSNAQTAERYRLLLLECVECVLRIDGVHSARRLLQHTASLGLPMDGKHRHMEQVLESIGKERAQMCYNFCTVVTPDYLCYALALHESLLAQCSEAVLHVLICPNGTEDRSAEYASESLRFYNSDDLCVGGIAKDLKDKYQGSYDDGFRWAMKSVFLSYLLTNEGCEKVFFADCDIFFFDEFAFLFEELDDCAMIVSPHWKPYSEPGKDKTFIYEEFFYNGMFNAGFVGVSRRGLEHLDWWARACLFNCYKDISNGFFVDQSHLTVLQAHFDGVKILKHRGCNVAHWNELESPRVEQEDGSVSIMGKYPIVFCHFALLCPDRYITGADKLLHAYFWKYVHCLKRHGLTRLRSLFTQFEAQLSALVWMLGENHVDAVALPGDDEEVRGYLASRGIAVNEAAGTVVGVCSKGMGGDEHRHLADEYDRCDVYILERELAVPEPAVMFVPTAAQRFSTVLEELREAGLHRILIYGGGMHTPKMLGRPHDLTGLDLLGIVDDAPAKHGLWLCGMTLVSAEEAKGMAADAVVVSSDTIEDVLVQQAQTQFPELPVYALYGGCDAE
jgi:hypothetical protein